MPQSVLSRRAFLAVTGLTAAALLVGCEEPGSAVPVVRTSPILSGPFATNLAILGETAGTTTMAQPFPPGTINTADLPFPLPTHVKAAIYYPFVGTASASPLHISHSGPFPVLLYAHAARPFNDDSPDFPLDRDFTTAEEMLRHVASYGCVCVAPDLSFLATFELEADAFSHRAVILVDYHAFLDSVNATLFDNRLDLTRLILVGHSTGAGGATGAGRMLSGSGSQLHSLSYGLIAPEDGGACASDIGNLLVLGGSLDTNQAAVPGLAYGVGGTPKTWVQIPGANHFGYTDLCVADNRCAADDPQGTISNAAQKAVGGAYLAALARYYALGDVTARPYLSGHEVVEGLAVTGLQIQSAGFPEVIPPTIGPATNP